MAVSKKRQQHTHRERRRQRERCEVKERATHRQNRFTVAVNDLCEADGYDEVRAALSQMQRIAPDTEEALSRILHAEPGEILASRRGWKSVTNNLSDLESEVWIYTPTIPNDWDESSIDQPTVLVVSEYDYYEIFPAMRGGRRAHGIAFYDNPFRLIREFPQIESW
ncbi:hypothetical protein CQ010_07030 [Arthrobacter sp. MYb211]|uniref:hypothetical protein n=1 Tax=Micrococcaceae TaxID=1268 RepID=UPI000CFAAF37|nr:MULTISPECIES: hypothetical protein [unclassified Arthrobacter]PQZ98921.1 hypothetical protein CQ017_10420 [Arthrobacter sp. MYb224]PRA03266.1 hypothetical protein CQ019_12565 [Arthrobacter sp. MYb229]PRA11840.1 hypothetical protein CQ015_07725 [Arthrobacter sp. MYb221]PRB49737.1 hypothetical protein CQ013_14045 [Arthrobacter sp. MYb216]PRC08197.1 hypothetical protein CQ010_07030 [Arthrobacter sp. MYb211]